VPLRDALRRLLGATGARDDDAARVVVVDTETTGLDAERDALVSIGAVAVDALGILPGDSFEVVVRRDGPVDARNAALHGIGAQAQAAGTPPREALAAFDAYVAGAPRVAFHADFDRRVLRRACGAAGVAFDARPWLDVAFLAASLEPGRWQAGARGLDDWLDAFGIGTEARHSAAGDALATAELFLRLRAKARAHGVVGHGALARAAAQRRWLGADR
jgi:DNA polymerase-3 subunit epsilon